MNYASTTQFTSAIYREATFSLKKMSVERRRQFHEQMAGPLAKLRELQDEREPLRAEWNQILETAKLAPCSCEHSEDQHDSKTRICKAEGCTCRTPKIPDELYAKLAALDDKEKRLDEDVMQPAVIRWGVKAISGLEIDEQPATVDSLIKDGPDDLAEELAREITRRMRRSGEEQKNLQPPTTSSAPVEATTLTTAPSAKTEDSTRNATAASTSPAT